MKKALRIASLVFLIALVGIQFIPTTDNQSEAVAYPHIADVFEIPDNVKSILETSCYNCHSDNTRYPWYNKLQPISWLLENHITSAKAELNFSEFGEYSDRRKRNKLLSVINQVKKDEMPLGSYTLIHTEAKLSEKQKRILIDWCTQIRGQF